MVKYRRKHSMKTTTKQILVTAVLAMIIAAFPQKNVKAISPEEIVSSNQEKANHYYLKNVEAVFSDGTEGKFISIEGNDVRWTTRTTPVGDPNHDIVKVQYRVQKGDCLWNISTAFGIPLEEILNLNSNLKNPDLIYPEDAIILMVK